MTAQHQKKPVRGQATLVVGPAYISVCGRSNISDKILDVLLAFALVPAPSYFVGQKNLPTEKGTVLVRGLCLVANVEFKSRRKAV